MNIKRSIFIYFLFSNKLGNQMERDQTTSYKHLLLWPKYRRGVPNETIIYKIIINIYY